MILNKLLILLFILSFNFQNIYLKNSLGAIGASGVNYFFPIALIGVFYMFLIKKLKINLLEKKMCYYLIFSLIISVFMNWFVGINYNSFEIYGEMFVGKTIKLFCYNLFGFTIISYFSRKFSQINTVSIKLFLSINFLFSVALLIFDILNGKTGRLFLLTSEPSEAGYIFTIFYLLFLYCNFQKKVLVGLSTFFYFIGLGFIGSKGSILCFFLAIILVLILDRSRKKSLKFFLNGLFIIMIIFLGNILFLEKLKNAFINDMKNYTSVITRTWSILVPIRITMSTIIGTSGTYLFYLKKIGIEIYKELKYSFPNFNYNEIEIMLSTGKNLTPKSGYFMEILIYGVGALYFYIFLWKYFSKFNNKIIKVLFYFVILSQITFISNQMTPTYILVFVVLNFIKIKTKSKEKIVLRENRDKIICK